MHNTVRAGSLNGYHISNYANGDVTEISVYMYDASAALIGEGYMLDSLNTQIFTAFSVPVTYTSSNAVDSMIIIFDMQADSPNDLSGYFVVDDLSLGANSGIADIPFVKNLNAWPNPVSDLLNVTFTSGHNSNVFLDVIDMQGRIIKTTEGIKVFTDNKIEMQIDVATLEAGIYFYRITDGESSICSRFIVN
jgi:hypothetical protein